MIEYPKKGSHYAHKTFRMMHKAMVAADYGRDVFCLLSIILHTEDAARYRGPVSYYNTQLMETLGFKKWQQFDAVRKKAIESGWLQYEGCGKRTPGRYFVTIPEGFEQVDDGLMEECISTENGYKAGYDQGYKAGYDEGVKWGINWGINSAQTGIQTGGTSNPSPTPSPNPEIKKDSSEPSRASEPVDTSITFNCVGKDPGPWSPPLKLIQVFRDAYPHHDVVAELRKAVAWIVANPAKRKTKKGMPAFLNRWMERAKPSTDPNATRQKTQAEKDAILAEARAQRAKEDGRRGA